MAKDGDISGAGDFDFRGQSGIIIAVMRNRRVVGA